MLEFIKGIFICSSKKSNKSQRYKPTQKPRSNNELEPQNSPFSPNNATNIQRPVMVPETPGDINIEIKPEAKAIANQSAKEPAKKPENSNKQLATTSSTSQSYQSEIDLLVAKLKGMSLNERIHTEFSFVEQYYNTETKYNYAIDAPWLEKYAEFLTKGNLSEMKECDNKEVARIVSSGEPNNDRYHRINQIIWSFIKKMYGAGPEVRIDDDESTNAKIRRSNSGASSRNTSFSESKAPKNSKLRPISITNERYFCYLNAITQALMGLEAFTETLTDRTRSGKIGSYTKAFLEILKDQKNNRDTNARSLKLLALNTFHHNEQHDAHEFLLHLLSNLQDEAISKKPKAAPSDFTDPESAWNYYKKYNNSVVDETFAGQVTSKVTCTLCNNVSYSYDPILDLSLPLGSKLKSLDDCISTYFKQEELPDLYNCEKCKKQGKAVKKFTLEKMPRVLALHLKRFQMYPKKKKIYDFVSFPVDYLSLRKNGEVTSEQVRYTLKGVVVHTGSVNSGHYVALSKRDNEWYLCDDESIRRVSSREIANKEAYILFYQRVD